MATTGDLNLAVDNGDSGTAGQQAEKLDRIATNAPQRPDEPHARMEPFPVDWNRHGLTSHVTKR